MLKQSFVHVPDIGETTERSLWAQGCLDWDTFLNSPTEFSLGSADVGTVTEYVERSQVALESKRHQFFQPLLGGREAWRAWSEFKDSCVYLDIETDGGQSGDSVTCVGLYDGTEFVCLIKGDDLGNFPDLISRYQVLVTFFGTGFDVPMLKKAFSNVVFDHIHIDLCHVLKRLGYRGGLKKIEQQMGIARPEETVGLSGLDAVRLWREHLRGDESSLEKLIAYNREDVVNLETLAGIAYEKMKAATMGQLALQFPS